MRGDAVLARRERESLRVVSWLVLVPSSPHAGTEDTKPTGAVRNDTALPPSLDQPPHSMERAPRLERANPLQVLALEPEPHDRPRPGRLPLRRRELVERAAPQHGGTVDVRRDELVGFENGVPR